MFWIGMIVGVIAGWIALIWRSRTYIKNTYGSAKDFADGTDLLKVATDNRKSYLQVYTDDGVLDTMTFEELT